MKKFITTPIYYVNDVPHIGQAYTTVAADVLARYYKSRGDEVFFLTGTDEHGAKIAEAACKSGKSPKDYVDELAPKFQSTWKNLNIEYSEFFRTTNPDHEKIVQDFVSELSKRGYVEKRNYEGLYCVGCEKYLAQNDLVDGKCSDHNKEPIKQSEQNYFFLLSKVAKEKDLFGKIANDEIQIAPKYRKNEMLGKLKLGLEDVSISRENVEWGIKFPLDESQTIYVWVDALINYYSATKIYKGIDDWKDHPADIHLMAKDILWFHAVIWPAMLLALDLPLPKKVFAHGFFTIAGQKMSKTIGNVLDPNALVDKFGADAVRYALLREFPFGEDGDISQEKIALRYTSDLSNGLGNLLNRSLNMIRKYNVEIDKSQSTVLPSNRESLEHNVEELEFELALSGIWRLIRELNLLIDETKPWELAKTDTKRLSQILNQVYSGIRKIAELISPFMPETSKKIQKQLETLEPEQLFPKIETKE